MKLCYINGSLVYVWTIKKKLWMLLKTPFKWLYHIECLVGGNSYLPMPLPMQSFGNATKQNCEIRSYITKGFCLFVITPYTNPLKSWALCYAFGMTKELSIRQCACLTIFIPIEKNLLNLYNICLWKLVQFWKMILL
jgi:hypothetical protein